MQIRIRGRNLDVAPETRHSIERIVRLTMGRHAAGIEHADVTLSPVVRPPSDETHRCRIRIRLREGPSLVIEDHARDPGAAATVAAWRLEQRLARRRAIQPAVFNCAPRRVPR